MTDLRAGARQAAIVAMAPLIIALAACGSGFADAKAWSQADAFAVVTSGRDSVLVGLISDGHQVARLSALDRAGDGAPVSVLVGSHETRPYLWRQGVNETTVHLGQLDRSAAALGSATTFEGGVLPFLFNGAPAWASQPGSAASMLAFHDATGQQQTVPLPGIPSFVAADPSSRFVAVVVDVPGRGERVFASDLSTPTWVELPTPDGASFGGLWTNGAVVAGSVRSQQAAGQTALEPDHRILRWTMAPDSIKTTELPTLQTGDVPTVLVGADEQMIVATGPFDQPVVEARSIVDGSAKSQWSVTPKDRVVSLWVGGSILLVLQEHHAWFIDLATGGAAGVELAGETQTIWQ